MPTPRQSRQQTSPTPGGSRRNTTLQACEELRNQITRYSAEHALANGREFAADIRLILIYSLGVTGAIDRQATAQY